MRSIFPSIKSKPTFNLDFSLLYIGIFLLTFSILGTELYKQYPESKVAVLQVRFIHTIYLLISVFAAQQLLKLLKISKSGYLGIFILGICLALPALFVRIFLMANFELVKSSEIVTYLSEQSLIALMQAFFWIPVAVILGGQRTKIFDVFKDYQMRLIISARRNIRESKDFIDLKAEVDRFYREELTRNAHLLLDSITFSENENLTLKEKNEVIQRYLKDNSLREFSRNLQKQSDVAIENSKFTQNMRSTDLISKQFNILYNFIARRSPLPAWVYTLLSFALIVPNYIHFFTLGEILTLSPILLLTIHFIATQIKRILLRGGKYAILQTNILTLLIGYLPLIEMSIFKTFNNDKNVQLPLFITAFFYPLGFFVYIRFAQIVQPEAIAAISKDQIKASAAMKNSILKIVTDEFRQSESHQWATYTHGKILTRLAATSLKLEQSSAKNDAENFELGLENLKYILENPTREFEQNNVSLKAEISSRLDPWEGLIAITINIDPALEEVTNERVKDLGEAVEEIISNSVRHGGSQNISINITLASHPDIQVRIEDDATNPLPLVPSRIGLGTKILNLVSDGRWSISRSGSKTTVDLTMSLLEKR